MLTTDLALRFDPAYEKISRRFLENPDQFADAFARAWFKLTHRDMGPRARYLGPRCRSRRADLAGPDPAVDHPLIDASRHRRAQGARSWPRACRLELVSTAWASASTFRGSDKRGGANGARIRLAPQKDWEVNQPAQLAKVLRTLEASRRSSTARSRRQEGLARRPDRAGGCAGVERPRRNAGPRRDGAVHAGPHGRLAGADRRRVLRRARAGRRRLPQLPAAAASTAVPAEELLVDKAQLLTLTAPEMTVLVGGLRVLAPTSAARSTASSRSGRGR
jgi:catalase-peroxidase